MPALILLATPRALRTAVTLLTVLALALAALLVTSPARAEAATADQVLAEAARHAGKPYRYGATGPSSFDCSGYTGYVFRQLGISLPRTSAAQAAALPRVPNDQKRPGDLIFTRDSGGRVYHVGIYAGGDQMWHAPSSGSVVKRSSIFSRNYTVGRTPLTTSDSRIDAHWAALGGARGQLGNPVSGEYPVGAGYGRNYAFGQILEHRAIGPRAVVGAIHGLYSALRWEHGLLGYPTSDEYGVPGGRASNFQGGMVVWSPGTGAFEVHGGILGTWLALGGTRSQLGFPISNELPAVNGGRVSFFQAGEMLWSATTGAHPVFGTIYRRYAALGGAQSALGFPVTGEVPVDGGVVQDFGGGAIYWDAATNRAAELTGSILSAYRAAGGPDGRLGLPVGPQYSISGGTQADFENGSITFDAKRQVTSVS